MSKKIKKWEDIDEKVRDKIQLLREREKENKEKSGYAVWKKSFIYGFGIYSVVVFLYLRRKISDINFIGMCKFMSPMLPYGFILKKQYFNEQYYKEYCKAHTELNKELFNLKYKKY